ncbi:MAG TPA: TonB family protein [Candidatus Angelobacter sp.]|nr:TonB family protein [Candidatus Angelobacter sp.]
MAEESGFGLSSGVRFYEVDRTLRSAPFLWSLLVHVAAAALLALFVITLRTRPVVVKLAKGQSAQMIPTKLVARVSSGGISAATPPKKSKKSGGRIRPSDQESALGVAAIRERARRETIGLVQNFKFRTTYGFSPNPKYELPVQTGGQYPVVTVEELPPRFEQYLIVEITIDSDGKVIDARLVAGETDTRIVSKVLAAVRQFKYRPATKEGIPIPSQTDLVIHIPT